MKCRVVVHRRCQESNDGCCPRCGEPWVAPEQSSFAFLVIVDPVAREAYLNRPDAENDFDRLNQLLGVPLDVFMLGILLGALLVPVVSFLLFRYRPWWRRTLARNP